jgi:hypothetical protein
MTGSFHYYSSGKKSLYANIITLPVLLFKRKRLIAGKKCKTTNQKLFKSGLDYGLYSGLSSVGTGALTFLRQESIN